MSSPIDLHSFSPEELSEDDYSDFLLELPEVANWSSPDDDPPGGGRTINLVGGDGFYAIYDDANGFAELDRDLTRVQAIEEWRSRLTADLVPFDGWFDEAFKGLAGALSHLPDAHRDEAVELAREVAREGANRISICCCIPGDQAQDDKAHEDQYLIDEAAADWVWSEEISHAAQSAAESWVDEMEAEQAAALFAAAVVAEPAAEPEPVDEVIWRVVRGEPNPWQLETVTRRADGLWWEGVKSAEQTPNRKSPFAKRGPFKDEAEIALKHSPVFWDAERDTVIIDKISIIFRVDYPIIPKPRPNRSGS